MSLINTREWLESYFDEPIELCEKIRPYFNDDKVTATEILAFLTMNGMYRLDTVDKEYIDQFIKQNFWNIVKSEERKLKKEWIVPNIPIFILPSDPMNREITKEYNGKSGIAFSDKLFLFLSDMNGEQDVQAVFTHEYNHVYRLYKYKRHETDYRLLDTIILEGLAENAVRERLGESAVAKWTTYYSDQQLEKFNHRYILPNYKIKKENHLYHRILYGLGLYPKMLGYCVGYFLVRNYLEANHLSVSDVMNVSSDQFLNERS
ncbi:DUF2268 domain-containing protein [Bacillus sp. PS06]|uniref:DUF2268 domain-containing protein n=1 Tax=Bacillus sp. PS06 TaxID=2764176 RepID=UPI00178271A1|nr:DUF2268 domain-containing protein [Bacillus sp. PS06]MBD8067542.1 DUF2268 domain-containing protein [Bacillus sp. PS06]